MKNCGTCDYMYHKDISYSNDELGETPEYVCICGEDNHYIGYDDDAQLQGNDCDKYKKEE